MSLLKKIIVFIIAFIIIILLISFYYLNSQDVIIYMNNQKINLNHARNVINLDTFNSEKNIIIKRNWSIAKIYVNGKKLKIGENLDLGKINISRDNIIKVIVRYINGDEKEFLINTLPEDFPQYDSIGKSNYDGDYYTSTYSFEYDKNHYIFKFDVYGNIKFYKKTNMVSFDFKKINTNDGKIRYTYLESKDIQWNGVTSILPCDLVVLDENYKEIDRINYIKENGDKLDLDNHTYIYLNDNHYILTSYEFVEIKVLGEDNIYIADCLIQERKNDKILWEFKTSSCLEFLEYSTKEYLDYSKKYQDYVHINWMDIDKSDENLICLFRNIDMIIKIDRSTGKIIWKMGGIGDEFKLSDEQKFSKQHSVISLENGIIMLYDNGNKQKRSRIIKLKIDEKNKRILEFVEYDLNIYAPMMGSVRVLNEECEEYLICYGGGFYDKYSIEEINYKNNVVDFKFTFLENKYIYNVNKCN